MTVDASSQEGFPTVEIHSSHFIKRIIGCSEVIINLRRSTVYEFSQKHKITDVFNIKIITLLNTPIVLGAPALDRDTERRSLEIYYLVKMSI